RLEEARVLRVRPRPAAFDVVDAEGVQPLRDGDLVGAGQVHVLPLRAVTQGGVVDLDGRAVQDVAACAHAGGVSPPAYTPAGSRAAVGRATPATSLFRTSTYAFAEASTTSVERPRPCSERPSLSTRMVTSPSASLPAPTERIS